MKIIELKCPACGGTIKVDEADKRTGICEYCGAKYLLVEEEKDEYRLDAYGQQAAPGKPQVTAREVKTRSHVYSVLVSVAGFFLLLGFTFFVFSGSGNSRSKTAVYESDIQKTEEKNGPLPRGEENIDKMVQSDLYIAVAEGIFEKPIEDITPLELETVKYLKIDRSSDNRLITYSMEDPYSMDQEINDHSFLLPGNLSYTNSDLACFKGLVKLDLGGGSANGSDLKGLDQLRGLIFGGTAKDAAEAGKDPSQMIELSLGSDTDAIDGLEVFLNLESLTMDYSDIADLTNLAALKKLTALKLIDCDEISDFSPLYTMNQLKELVIDSESLKDIGFITGMGELESLWIEDSQVLNLNGLKGNTSLTSLTLVNNQQISDYSPVSGLNGLAKLTLRKYTTQNDPDLGSLGQLSSLDIQGFNSISFLRSMGNLNDLIIRGSNINDRGAFEGLVNLKTLKCTSMWGDIPDLRFISGLPSLTELDLTGMSFYGDVSEVFNIPTLEKLKFDEGEFELNFAKLKPAPSLKWLSLNKIKLYCNVKVQTDGFITSVDYDDVTMDENTDFLTNYPELTYLSVQGNKLTQAGFAASLTKLEELNLDENYVTDLKPLEQLEYLKTLHCKGNPVSNFQFLGEKTEVFH